MLDKDKDSKLINKFYKLTTEHLELITHYEMIELQILKNRLESLKISHYLISKNKLNLINDNKIDKIYSHCVKINNNLDLHNDKIYLLNDIFYYHLENQKVFKKKYENNNIPFIHYFDNAPKYKEYIGEINKLIDKLNELSNDEIDEFEELSNDE